MKKIKPLPPGPSFRVQTNIPLIDRPANYLIQQLYQRGVFGANTLEEQQIKDAVASRKGKKNSARKRSNKAAA